jgi:hypothetical protein
MLHKQGCDELSFSFCFTVTQIHKCNDNFGVKINLSLLDLNLQYPIPQLHFAYVYLNTQMLYG